MSTHSLDNQLPERLLEKIAQLEKQIRELRTLQLQGYSALQIRMSPLLNVSFPSVPNGAGFQHTTSLAWEEAPPSGNVLMAAPLEFTLYRNTVDNSGRLTTNNPSFVSWSYWRHQYLPELYATHINGNGSYPVTDVVSVNNNSGSTSDFFLYYRWRYIVVDGDVEGVTGLPDPPDGPM